MGGGIHIDGIWQLIGFMLLSLVVFAEIFAVYVGVAQPYHTYRLMTAGPTGFEAATMYYLDNGIIFWRHTAIRLMLYSLPIYVTSHAFRFIPQFDRVAYENEDVGQATATVARIEGFCFMILYFAVACG